MAQRSGYVLLTHGRIFVDMRMTVGTKMRFDFVNVYSIFIFLFGCRIQSVSGVMFGPVCSWSVTEFSFGCEHIASLAHEIASCHDR